LPINGLKKLNGTFKNIFKKPLTTPKDSLESEHMKKTLLTYLRTGSNVKYTHILDGVFTPSEAQREMLRQHMGCYKVISVQTL
jgi:hypothetical protein